MDLTIGGDAVRFGASVRADYSESDSRFPRQHVPDFLDNMSPTTTALIMIVVVLLLWDI
ncbi:hypothetical protein Pla100_47240 [Neorhodopirellula pilleata]|uniref:Uncharacterized protein n=1 Tax=Neorhodopirellula pilleata TaxID=2714738 RepID=A0A5C5ZYV0_9BACT|nr:hypothetical protein Pla100_47240 [Neorhodopirellula pilleata]